MRARTLQLNKSHSSGQGTVHLIDDDYDIRTQLGALLRLLGYDVRTYADPMSFLESPDSDQPSVVILEMTMPQMSGLDVQKNLTQLACALLKNIIKRQAMGYLLLLLLFLLGLVLLQNNLALAFLLDQMMIWIVFSRLVK